jgi:F-type H+-transporting ATPase subunit epsilon
MADGIRLEIVSPERLVFSETVRSVTVPGIEGYFTVLGDHAPMMTILRPGFITVVDGGGASNTYYVRGGFADVSPEGLTILAERASSFADFDPASIAEELRLAQADLAKAEPGQESFAQELVNGLANLSLEASQIGPGQHIH